MPLGRYRGIAPFALADAFVVEFLAVGARCVFLVHFNLQLKQVRIGLNSKVAGDYGVKGAPEYILIGKDGRILLSREDNWTKITAAVNKTLAKK